MHASPTCCLPSEVFMGDQLQELKELEDETKHLNTN